MDKKYEIMTIIDLKLGESDARNISNTIRDLVASSKGKVINGDFWGKRKLAYPINHQTEAYYDVVSFNMHPKNVTEFKTKLSFVNGIVRYLITVVESDK